MAKLGLNQGMRQRQEMVLAPRMLQSIEILALPTTDLEGWLAREAQENEALVVGPAAEAQRADDLGPTRSSADRSRASDDHYALLQAQPDPESSLPDIVEKQLAGRDLGPELVDWVRFLVGCLDPAGLLSVSDDELLTMAVGAGLPGAGQPAGQSHLGRAIAELQQLDPPGIGARSSVEALLLQLDPEDEDYAVLCALLEDFLVELSRNHRPKVASELGLELQELDRLLSVLGQLDTRPAASLVPGAAPVIHPDVLVQWDGTGFTVDVARSALPAVSIDPAAEELLESPEVKGEARTYLRGKVDKARFVTEAVEMRGVTLHRVATAIFKRQTAFLKDGVGSLAPLSMTEVAAELEIAVSTISRTVAGKYCQTPTGIFPLRMFFQTAAGDGADGQVSSTEAVRDRVKRLVGAEDPSAPLSDEALVEALKAEGMPVARRTVAKYRGELGIPSSYRRKRHVD